MTNFHITHEWSSYDDARVEVGKTTARVGIFLDNYCLTKNEDIWSKTIRDQMHVSLYPLAMWFASSWWRLHYEVLPDSTRAAPSHDWRMSHEMAAANMGFVWPKIMFSADSDSVQIWAQSSQVNKEESARFLNGLDHAHSIPKVQFTHEISSLIGHVLARLHEVGCKDSDLAAIWGFITEDLKNPVELRKRRIEAELGFDPENCPERLIVEAIALEEKIGASSFSELTGAYADSGENRLGAMQKLVDAVGLEGKPDNILDISIEEAGRAPWEVAVSAARELRRNLGDANGALDGSTLRDLLGLSEAGLKSWIPRGRPKASVAGPDNDKAMKIIPRKTHPIAQRFELARFVGDYVRSKNKSPHSWLVSADLSTSRQKFQRAFAAELLCPINSLVGYLGGDFSETALEDAADHFMVSEKTVDSLLVNNGYFPRSAPDSGMPYSLAS